MIGNKYAEESIAQDFLKILSERKKEAAKTAQELSFGEAVDSEPEEDIAMEPSEEVVEDLGVVDPADFLTTIDDGSDEHIENALDDKISIMENKADESELYDSTAAFVLNGLGKIAASLSGKGNKFAADVVEATANGIKEDLIKEAQKKVNVITELNKIAKELDNSGNKLASDIVQVTIEKIKKA